MLLKNCLDLVLVFCAVAFVTFPVDSFGQQADPPPDGVVDSATRTSVIEKLISELDENYVFPEIAAKMNADLKKRMASSEYESLNSSREFAKKLTEDLQAISKDKHLRVRFSPNPVPVRAETFTPTAEQKAKYRSDMNFENHGFTKVERLRGNIGYIELMGFFDPELGAETVKAAMSFVANTDAIIFDLRRNGGGDPAMVAHISSYLFGDKPVHLNDLYWRKGDKTEEFWTDPKIANIKLGDKPIYVLTSNRTFSGAEEFSYNLKNLKRATIVGETTGGGAHPGGSRRLGEHFQAFVPGGRAISPITKTNWEGTGVEPDVKVEKESALLTAQILILKQLASNTKDDNRKGLYARLIKTIEGELKPTTAVK
jgi:C-terminal processing protease CtpA/Prc